MSQKGQILTLERQSKLPETALQVSTGPPPYVATSKKPKVLNSTNTSPNNNLVKNSFRTDNQEMIIPFTKKSYSGKLLP